MKHTEKMNEIVSSEFIRFVTYISNMDSVVKIYLFGSYAYGNPTEDSDIDLFVVIKDGIDSLKIMQKINYGLCDMKIALDVIADNISTFNESSKPDRVTLQREVKNKGVLLYG